MPKLNWLSLIVCQNCLLFSNGFFAKSNSSYMLLFFNLAGGGYRGGGGRGVRTDICRVDRNLQRNEEVDNLKFSISTRPCVHLTGCAAVAFKTMCIGSPF